MPSTALPPLRVGLLAGCALLGGCDLVVGIGDVDTPIRLRFDNGDGSTDLVDMPVLVSLDASVLDYAQVSEPATDLRFVDPTTKAELPFEVDHWDPAGESALWVRVPLIRAGSVADEIWMWTGAGIATTAPDPVAVWRGSYELVSHLQAIAPSVPDVLGGHPGTPENVTLAAGVVGGALELGVDSRVMFETSLALLDGQPQFTVELWVAPALTSIAGLVGEPMVFGKRPALTSGRVIRTGALQCDVQFASVETAYLNAQVIMHPVDQPWSYVVYTSDGQTLALYLNGERVGDAPAGVLASGPMAEPLALGNPNQADTLAGRIDELRVSHVGRSADWVRAQYRAVSGELLRFK